MIRLSAFADEISPELQEQLTILKSEKIHAIDLRGAWESNVLDFTEQQVEAVRQALQEQNVQVAALASPIGKVAIDTPFENELKRFDRALELAQIFQTRYIRIFSFYPPSDSQGQDKPERWRDEVIKRLRELTARAKAANIYLLHENEKKIYGDTIARCVDLLKSIDDPFLQAAFDPANFIECEQTPYPDAYEAIKPWLRYVHVKDALPDGKIVAAGEGAADWPALLRRLREDGYEGVFALEPHLAIAEYHKGFSGPALFRHASQSLQRLLQEMGWEY